MFIFDGLKKGAEVVGIIDEVEEVVEEQPVTAESPKPKAIKMKEIDIKPVGNVPPYIKVINPADDLAKLEEAFGVYHSGEKMMTLECPECGHEASIPFKGVHLEDDCTCSECEYEAEFDDFYSGSSTEPTTSRTPSNEEVWMLVEGSSNTPSFWGSGAFDNIRVDLMKYYRILKGDAPIMPDEYLEAGRRDDGYNGSFWAFSCRGCQTPGDGCQCSNGRMKYFGQLHSIAEVRAAEEQEDD